MIISKSTKNRFFGWLFDFFKISENSGYMLEIIGYSLRTVIMNPTNCPDNLRAYKMFHEVPQY
jgi:hypothetical protein